MDRSDRPGIALADSDAAIARCHGVMHALRPQLAAADFVARVREQEREGYHLAYLEDQGAIRALAGFRVYTTLAWGRILYVDDLVADPAHRSQGYGAHLFDWLVDQARRRGCDQLHLDSGVQRFPAHRFYLARRMIISGHHFSLELDTDHAR